MKIQNYVKKEEILENKQNRYEFQNKLRKHYILRE